MAVKKCKRKEDLIVYRTCFLHLAAILKIIFSVKDK